jgi:hypothetical protein
MAKRESFMTVPPLEWTRIGFNYESGGYKIVSRGKIGWAIVFNGMPINGRWPSLSEAKKAVERHRFA